MGRIYKISKFLSIVIVSFCTLGPKVVAMDYAVENESAKDSLTYCAIQEDCDTVFLRLNGISCDSMASEYEIEIDLLGVDSNLLACCEFGYSKGDTFGVLAIKPVQDAYGIDTFQVVLASSKGLSRSKSCVIQINPVNDKPYVSNPISDQLIHPGDYVEIPISPVPGVIFSDPDDRVLSCILRPENGYLPSFCSFVQNTLVVSPTVQDTGVHRFAIKAFDSKGESVSDTFNICVVNEFAVTVKEFSPELSMVVFPNPTAGRIQLKGLSPLASDQYIYVKNSSGQEVIKRYLSNFETAELDLTGMADGIYFVGCQTADQCQVQKVILKKYR